MSEFESIFESIVGRLRKDYKVGGRVESNVHYYGTNNKKGFATQGFRQSQADKIVKLKEILTKWKNGEGPLHSPALNLLS